MDRLRPLWDFGDLDLSEQRLRAQLEQEEGAGRAEVLTQLARVEGLRGDFDACDELLAQAEQVAGDSAVAHVRIALERGRRVRSSGGDALALFVEAFDRAVACDEHWLAGDAAHMAALAGPMQEWTERGLELAEREPAARYWRGSLLNNLGWHLLEAGAHEEAIRAFEQALAAREEDPANVSAIEAAHEALAEARRAAGRAAPGR